MKRFVFLLLLCPLVFCGASDKPSKYAVMLYSGGNQIGTFAADRRPTFGNGVATFIQNGREVIVSGTYVVMEQADQR
jgi:hypothetical protein